MSSLEILLVGTVLTVATAAVAFWIWMLVDCIKNEPRDGNERLVWVLVIVFTKIVGAAIYYFVRHAPRLRNSPAS